VGKGISSATLLQRGAYPALLWPVFWAEEVCTNSLIFFSLYGKIHPYERVIDRINSGKEKKS
jgi:hypothetical protein